MPHKHQWGENKNTLRLARSQMLRQHNYMAFHWNADSVDWKVDNKADVESNVLDALEGFSCTFCDRGAFLLLPAPGCQTASCNAPPKTHMPTKIMLGWIIVQVAYI